MESSIVFPISRLSFSPSKPHHQPLPFQPWKHRTPPPATTRVHCHKMYVPGHGTSSEKTAAKHLHHFFNFVAVKIVAAQLQSYNPEAYDELMEFVERHSLNDADKFCADMMRESSRHQNLALRIMEVRSAYCKEDFEWDNLKRVASKMMDEANTRLLRSYIMETSCLDKGK